MEGASLSDRSARSSSPSPSTNPPAANCSDAGTPSEDSSARLRWRRVNASSCDVIALEVEALGAPVEGADEHLGERRHADGLTP